MQSRLLRGISRVYDRGESTWAASTRAVRHGWTRMILSRHWACAAPFVDNGGVSVPWRTRHSIARDGGLSCAIASVPRGRVGAEGAPSRQPLNPRRSADLPGGGPFDANVVRVCRGFS